MAARCTGIPLRDLISKKSSGVSLFKGITNRFLNYDFALFY